MGNIPSPESVEACVYNKQGILLGKGLALVWFDHPAPNDVTSWIVHIYRARPTSAGEVQTDPTWEPPTEKVYTNNDANSGGVIVYNLNPGDGYYFTVSARGTGNRVSSPSVPSNSIRLS
jgi:hypothetical protein